MLIVHLWHRLFVSLVKLQFLICQWCHN